MNSSFGSPVGQPLGTHGEWYSFGISFYPAGEGSCLVLETTSQNLWVCSSFGQRYIALDQRFFLVPFYFISMPNFDIMLWVFIIPLGKGYLSLILCPFTQGLWMAFVGHEKQFLRAIPRVDPITSSSFSHIFMASRLHSHAKPVVMEILDKHSTKGKRT